MYIVIVGAGRVGVSMAKWLMTLGHEVTVVECDESKCVALDKEMGGISVVGDGTEVTVLAEAGTSRASIFFAATDRDEDNLVACQLAKHHFQVPRSVSLISTADHERLFNMLGIDVTIETTGLIVDGTQREMIQLIREEMEEAG